MEPSHTGGWELAWDPHSVFVTPEWVDWSDPEKLQVGKLKFPDCFPSYVSPVRELFTPRSSFHYDKDLFFQLKSDFSNPWDSYSASQWPDSDFEVTSNPAFSLYQIWEWDGSYTEHTFFPKFCHLLPFDVLDTIPGLECEQ